MSQLEELKRHTLIVADTGDIDSIERYKPRDTTTNPSLLTAAAQMPAYAPIVDEVIARTKKASGGKSDDALLQATIEALAVEFGSRILAIVPGRVSTEVDARISYDTAESIERARRIISLYAEKGIERERILVKLASTWEGIKAAEALEKEGIHCNMTLLFGMHQAVACAEAKATLISPFVGRILDFYLKKTGKTSFAPAEDPGVISVTRIYEYYKKFDHPTEVMGASFRNVGEILELAGCDLLTISPKLLGELAAAEGKVERKLVPERAKQADVERMRIDKDTFDKMHAADEMASFKLDEGIKGFTKALEELEGILRPKLAAA